MPYFYLYILDKINHGTLTTVKLEKIQVFFIAMGTSIEGFEVMRKLITMDAIILKILYGGILVFAMVQDPNQHHYISFSLWCTIR